MNLDHWTNPKTQVVIGSNTMIGSPRGWVYRCLDTKSMDQFNELGHPGSINIGGVWTRNSSLPNNQPYYAIYRYFELPKEWSGRGREAYEYERVIGMGMSVPIDKMMEYYKIFSESGALWVWSSMPHINKNTLIPSGLLTTKSKERVRLDHAYIYKLFENGETVSNIAARYDCPRPTIEYIHTKWINKQPAHIQKKPLDREAIIRDLKAGMIVQEVANKHETSRTAVYNIRNKIMSV